MTTFSTSSQLKDLPKKTPTKGELYIMYKDQFKREEMIQDLAELIQEHGEKIGIEVRKKASIIKRYVWLKWLKIYGLPSGYKAYEGLQEEINLLKF